LPSRLICWERFRKSIEGEIKTCTINREADGITVCSPVGQWAMAEIWAYLDWYSLPYPAFYYIDREKIRIGPPISVTDLQIGGVGRFQ
jgi:3'-phosphoadenosine 5'-phosphosulfate sulfotransferase (PAPS reductase)/FAD synthetase